MDNLDDAASLVKHFEKLDKNRDAFTSKWKINLAFYKGRQYVFWNKAGNRLESLPVDEGEKPRHRVRKLKKEKSKGLLTKATESSLNSKTEHNDTQKSTTERKEALGSIFNCLQKKKKFFPHSILIIP
jgi:hypothetical protein